jgi:hypothetical protein
LSKIYEKYNSVDYLQSEIQSLNSLKMLILMLKTKKIVKSHIEDFLMQHVLKNKKESKSLSCLDWADITTKSKGPKLKIDKKNLDSQYIYDKNEGKNLISNTINYFNKFDNNVDLKFTQNNLMNEFYGSKTLHRDEKNLNRLVFFDTSSKIEFFNNLPKFSNLPNSSCLPDLDTHPYNYLLKLDKQVMYLDKISKKLKKRKKKHKIPVYFCFYTRNEWIQFSMFYSLIWVQTIKSSEISK